VRKLDGGDERIVDAGVVDKRLCVFEGEFASVLKVATREGNTLSPVIRLAWDSGDLRSLVKTSPARATGALISIVGHITRDELLRHLTDTEAGNGFANRFLWFCTRRSKVLPFGGEPPAYGDLVKRLYQAIQTARTISRVTWAEDGARVWEAVYPDLSESPPGLLGAVTGRAEAQVLRLAALYTVLDGAASIRREHLLAALAVWEFAAASAAYIFGDATGDHVADRIQTALRETPGGLARTDISGLFGRNVPTARIQVALALLERLGRARREVNPSEDGGRPAERWVAIGRDRP
jgi:hypothetical protein